MRRLQAGKATARHLYPDINLLSFSSIGMVLVKGLIAAECSDFRGKAADLVLVWVGEVERKGDFTKGGGKRPEEHRGGETKQVSWK